MKLCEQRQQILKRLRAMRRQPRPRNHGLPIGVVTLATDGVIEVQPYVNRERIEYVRVLDYGLTGIIQSGPDRRIGSNVR